MRDTIKLDMSNIIGATNEDWVNWYMGERITRLMNERSFRGYSACDDDGNSNYIFDVCSLTISRFQLEVTDIIIEAEWTNTEAGQNACKDYRANRSLYRLCPTFIYRNPNTIVSLLAADILKPKGFLLLQDP